MDDELIRAEGTDGHLYVVRALAWSIDKLKEYWARSLRHRMFSDQIGSSYENFVNMVTNGGLNIWFEVIDWTSGEIVGLMYLSNFSAHGSKLDRANWHGYVWDAKASIRFPVVRAALRRMFVVFGLHRIQAEVPVKFGGAIRTLIRLGFKPEGRFHQAVLYDGIWYDSIVFGIVETESNNWKASESRLTIETRSPRKEVVKYG